MDFIVPEDFILEKFYEHAGYPKYKSHTNIYEAGCPICREGDSWGRKRRLYYIVKKNLIYCHNCGWSGNPIKWIAELENKPYLHVISEAKKRDYVFTPSEEVEEKIEKTPSLPGDCINLGDAIQLQNNKKKLKEVLDYVKSRRLDSAVNRPRALWYCENDKTHYNRLIIPYYYNGDIQHYQSRSILKDDKRPKYLSKRDSQVSIFNYDNVRPDNDTVFIFEGPIDSFFMKNGVALGGINTSKRLFSSFQEAQMETLKLYNKIWVLDNQYIDDTGKKKTKSLIDMGETCFIWPKEWKKYKDFNDVCIALNCDEIEGDFIKKHSFKGVSAKMRLSKI